MDVIKNNRLNVIATFLYILIYALTKNTIYTLLYFIIIYLLEIYCLLKNDFEKVFLQSISLIPLLGIVGYKGIPLFNIYNILLVFFEVFINRNIKINKKVLLIFILFVLLEFLKILLVNNGIDTFYLVLSVPLLYVSMFSGIIIYNKIDSYAKLKLYSISFILGTILSIVYGFLTRFMVGGLKFAIINSSIMTRNAGASGDPNYFGLYICFSAVMLLVFISHDKKNIIPNLLLIFIMLVMGLSSSSRMYYILVAMIFVLLFIVIIKGLLSRKLFKWVFVVALVGLLLFLGRNIIFSNIDYLMSRLSDADISNGRFRLVDSYTGFLRKNILIELFGIGIPKYNVRSGITGYAHNIYIELLVSNGVVGVFIIACFLLAFLIRKVKIKNIYYMFPFLILVVAGLALNFIEVDCFYLLFGLIFAYLKIGKKQKNI